MNGDEYNLDRDIDSYTTVIGTLKTHPLDADAAGHETLSGIGMFEFEVRVIDLELKHAVDASGFLKHNVANALAHAVANTTVPQHLWYFETTPLFRQIVNIDAPFLPFGGF